MVVVVVLALLLVALLLVALLLVAVLLACQLASVPLLLALETLHCIALHWRRQQGLQLQTHRQR